MFQAIKDRLALRRWTKSALGGALQHHGHEYFWAKGAPFSYMDEQVRLKHCAELHAIGMEVMYSENPLLAVREKLASYVHAFAPLMVGGMREDPERAAMDVYNTPYISAKLRPHIEAITHHLDELGKVRFDDPNITAEELAEYSTTRASLLLFYCNGINLISIVVEDRVNDRSDWYQAYMQAAMVWAEDSIRRDLGISSLLPNSTDGLVYSSFMNYVVNGEPDPFFSWCKTFPDRYLLGHGPKPEG